MADGRAMQEILKNHGLEHLLQRFQLEKISPDIFCQLTSHEMEGLFVQNRSDMMNLRLCCSKYGTSQPIKVITNGGVQDLTFRNQYWKTCWRLDFTYPKFLKFYLSQREQFTEE